MSVFPHFPSTGDDPAPDRAPGPGLGTGPEFGSGTGSGDALSHLMQALGVSLSPGQRQQLDLMRQVQNAMQNGRQPPHKSPQFERPQTARQRPKARDFASLAAITEGLQAHSEMIACALGACPSCWGSDPDCTDCAGEGTAGFFLPDEACFETFVIPVIRRVLQDQSGDRNPMSKAKGEDTHDRTD
ncbi:MAG: hypothetical protein AAGF20_05300 [Pseudomonadota bacterium]